MLNAFGVGSAGAVWACGVDVGRGNGGSGGGGSWGHQFQLKNEIIISIFVGKFESVTSLLRKCCGSTAGVLRECCRGAAEVSQPFTNK